MSLPDEIQEAEDRLSKAGITLKLFQQEAGIDPVTWWRWRTGKTEPRLSDWRKFNAELDRMAPRHK